MSWMVFCKNLSWRLGITTLNFGKLFLLLQRPPSMTVITTRRMLTPWHEPMTAPTTPNLNHLNHRRYLNTNRSVCQY